MRVLLPVALLVLGACADGGPGPTDHGELFPTFFLAHSDTLISAVAGTGVAVLPSVVVKDQNGAPMSGVPVAFAVALGGGTVVVDHPSTNDSGIATVTSWTLGATPGLNRLTASAATLSPLTFAANGISPSCADTTPLLFPTSLGATLSTDDCSSAEGNFVDNYLATLGTPASAYYVRQTSNTIDSYLRVTTPEGRPLAFNDDSNSFTYSSATLLLVPPGTVHLVASSHAPHDTGAYNIAVIAASSQVQHCAHAFTVRGYTTNQIILDDDCHEDSGRLYGDLFYLYLLTGEQVVVTETSPDFDALLGIYNSTTLQLITGNDNASDSTTNSRIPFTAPSDGYYIIFTSTATDTTKGTYTLSIQVPSASAHLSAVQTIAGRLPPRALTLPPRR